MEAAFEQYARLYVLGDIHGRLDLLNQLIDAVHRDVDQFGGNSLTVTLGDYIDRGPNSRGVIERLMTNPFPGDYVALKGNHDAMLSIFLDDPSIGPMWLKLGGLETLRSFGISVPRFTFGQKYKRAAEQLRTVISREHLNFLTCLKTSLTIGHYFFCHAGVRPGVPLGRQSEEDLLWIRDEFTKSKTNFGNIVVHGHTPVAKPEVLSNRINIDTGAFATGRLTCLVLEAASHRIIST
jgi:serine/threonine protein phosphatase 1